ncbi:hypothetical protein CPKG_00047 [Cyanophage KBS-S-2A]|uniref:hypothetical protein n=1 Tax=Cyanophage KBS-S-2A TaxID=889953 RepID=UPI0002C18AB2|nr:hypothetical protein CPKG_00047 [Cyanophage KBS-S-2A]AGH57678.1 hypothetical protein CPKG_00047 [Cyanophage KBS-S-2A]
MSDEPIRFIASDNQSEYVSPGTPLPVALTGLEIPAHDYIDLSYTGSNLTSVVYKDGGSGGTTVATLTLAYDGNDNLISVTKS